MVDPALVFLTGGLALVNISNSIDAEDFNVFKDYGYSNTRVEAGWTVGGGAEFAVTDNISLSAQYLFVDLPQYSESYSDNYEFPAAHFKADLNDTASILRVGLNWHFD